MVKSALERMLNTEMDVHLGRAGGAAGGYLLAEGTPEEIAGREGNETGRWVRGVV